MAFADPRALKVPAKDESLPGRAEKMPVPERHFVLGTPLDGPVPSGFETATFGLGCFWGAERKFWQLPGVHSTSVGYAGGHTPNPTYREVCSGGTGHAEVVRVVFDPSKTSFEDLLRVFFEAHDPTQGMRQGNDVGTQYRSVILTHDARQRASARAAKARYEQALAEHGYPAITTAIEDAGPYYFAEDYHQQYLAKNPGGYCGLGGTGVTCR
jgi:peptide-methionine (S)-S-oxide reductase